MFKTDDSVVHIKNVMESLMMRNWHLLDCKRVDVKFFHLASVDN
jgi:hypothetical protein